MRDLWESGYWNISEHAALKAIGGNIYLFEEQSGRSFQGGVIKDYTIIESGENADQIIFLFESLEAFIGISAFGGPNGKPEGVWNGEVAFCHGPTGFDVYLLHGPVRDGSSKHLAPLSQKVSDKNRGKLFADRSNVGVRAEGREYKSFKGALRETGLLKEIGSAERTELRRELRQGRSVTVGDVMFEPISVRKCEVPESN